MGLVSNIYPNINKKAALNNCIVISEIINENYTFIYCRIKQEEIKYFEDNKDLPLAYDIFCGSREPMNAFVYKLDKTKYPVFKVKYFVIPEGGDKCSFIIVANIKGSISEFTEGNEFMSLININSNDNIETYYLKCEIPLPSKIQDNYEILCEIENESENDIESCSYLLTPENNTESYTFHLTPYYMILNSTSPFEVFIENTIKAIKYDDYKKIKEKTLVQNLLSLFKSPVVIVSLILIFIILFLLKQLL